ncbi:MAG: hypothetical protein QNJ53_18435 [Pleurocapsa sp. MO_192.B19]|nr:hypothetical protein [Pleurocapsa sp. MO_192.B19]
MSRNTVTPKIFMLLMAIAMFLSSWVLPTWLWQFSFLPQIFI